MKQIIDLETWERRDNFRFFQDYLNPFVSITSEVECGGAWRRAKESGGSFFLHYLYAILNATNQVKEMRYRLDNEERIVLYDKVDAICAIHIEKTGHFYSARIPWCKDFDSFCQKAAEIIRNAPEDGNPYGEEAGLFEAEFDVINVSALPDLYFTSVHCTQKHRNGADYPLLNVGKAILKEGKWVMPIALAVHHGFMDGKHMARFYALIAERLK